MSQEEIEDEVKARVTFKMNEILAGVKNRIGFAFSEAFAEMTPKSEGKWEAWKELEVVIKKEVNLPVPYDDMARRNEWKFKEMLLDEFKGYLTTENLDRRQYDRLARKVVSLIESAIKYRNS